MQKYGWEIKRIDRDVNPSLAARLGVESVPALILIYKGSREHIPVSAGVASLSDIEERLYRGIRLLKGETTPENWSLYDFQKGQGFDVKAPLSSDTLGGKQ